MDVATGFLTMVPLEGHTGAVRAVAFSPYGQHVTSGSDDNTNTVIIWHAQTGETATGLLGWHTEPARSVAFRPMGEVSLLLDPLTSVSSTSRQI